MAIKKVIKEPNCKVGHVKINKQFANKLEDGCPVCQAILIIESANPNKER